MLVTDFESAREDGEHQVEKYFEEGIKSSTKTIIKTIPQNKRHTFEHPPPEKGAENKTPKKTDAMENKAMIKLPTAPQESALD